MKFSIEHGPSFAWLRVQLDPNESIQAEAGSMVTRTPSLGMTTRLNAGRAAGVVRKLYALLVAVLRKVFGGEAMFINEFAGGQGGEVVFAPHLPGSIVHRPLKAGERLLVEAGAYLASTGSVDARLKWGGLRALFGGEGLFLLECTGEGDLFLSAYGGVHRVEVKGGYVVDTGHIVAFDGSLDFRVRSAGGVTSFLFSGEGLVCQFKGEGALYLQSRHLGSLVSMVTPFLRA